MKTLTLDGNSLTLADLAPLVRGEDLTIAVTPGSLEAVKAARDVVDRYVEAGDVVYGLTTGFGKLKSVAVAREDLEQLQENLIISHCCGVGEPLPHEEVRIMQVLRLNGLLRGHSGVRISTIEYLVAAFNAGFTPIIPRKGSVGASGDLAPLAHLCGAYMGYGDVWLGGERMSAKDALAKAGLEILVLAAKEGLALINGTECMKAAGVCCLARATNLSKAADSICSLSLEALMGSLRPFDDRLADLKGNAGHRRTAANMRGLLEGSKVLESHADCDRVQDPYSLRCVPQIHGAFKTALEHVTGIFEQEVNAVTDNPIIFPDTGEVVSAGQFHGQQLSMAMDYLGLAICTLANVSERRVEQLVNPDLSNLPAFLTPNPGINSGFMIAQVAAAALASENKVLAHPASVDTVPTSANQEDHVSMGVTAARKALEICSNTESVLAIEWLAAAQGREFNADVEAGRGPKAARECLRASVPALKEDRYMHPDMERATELLRSGELVAAVEGAAGILES